MTHSPIIYSLGADFYDAVTPARFPISQLRWFNYEAAQIIGLGLLSSQDIQNHFWSFEPFKSNLQNPLALRYHGHQFRHYNPDLGDGRGFLLAQFSSENKIYDLSTKGSGPTPYSRGGDGKLTLKGALREILATEYLESLGVNTSKTLAVFETGEKLQRGDEPSPARSAVLTRMVHSSIRFGTFQRLSYLNHVHEMEKLIDYCLENYFPKTELKSSQKVSYFYNLVIRKTADLAAQFMTAGFVHGVLNTDNMNITGEVFDFGPYRFLPSYNPYYTAAYFDHKGLYSFGRQPESFLWGLKQLGLALKKLDPLLEIDSLLQEYSKEFYQQHKKHFFRRLNLQASFDANDDKLIENFYEMLSVSGKLFELCYFDFYGGHHRQAWKINSKDSGYQDVKSQNFISALHHYKVEKSQYLQHPYFSKSKPETLLIQDIEHIWQAIDLKNDWSLFHQKIHSLRSFRGVYDEEHTTQLRNTP